MAKGLSFRAVRPFKVLFAVVVLGVVTLTLAALVEVLLGANWGLGLSVFLLGLVASVWGLFAYPMCGGCCGWDRKGD
ncbi:hypothetical protein [Novosphingobium gossypii]|uniref:hypothetical protein n=1 Tax=Novosphingobium gossypii TaxID=1604774 RepID=UPI003D1E57FB